MIINIGMRQGSSLSNKRLDAVYEGLNQTGNTTYKTVRSNVRPCDLWIQAGFQSSAGLRHAILTRNPYIIIEYPHWRPTAGDHANVASWGYNGLGGFGWRPAASEEPRQHPKLKPWKESGAIIIFGQKPNDHSLDGSDHVAWIKKKRAQNTAAEFRHHPIMCAGRQETSEQVLDRCGLAITYSSTIGVEALIAGCLSYPESKASMAFDVKNREAWIHELSYSQYGLHEWALEKTAKRVLAGYEEAADMASTGFVQHPRHKETLSMDRYFEEFGN